MLLIILWLADPVFYKTSLDWYLTSQNRIRTEIESTANGEKVALMSDRHRTSFIVLDTKGNPVLHHEVNGNGFYFCLQTPNHQSLFLVGATTGGKPETDSDPEHMAFTLFDARGRKVSSYAGAYRPIRVSPNRQHFLLAQNGTVEYDPLEPHPRKLVVGDWNLDLAGPSLLLLNDRSVLVGRGQSVVRLDAQGQPHWRSPALEESVDLFVALEETGSWVAVFTEMDQSCALLNTQTGTFLANLHLLQTGTPLQIWGLSDPDLNFASWVTGRKVGDSWLLGPGPTSQIRIEGLNWTDPEHFADKAFLRKTSWQRPEGYLALVPGEWGIRHDREVFEFVALNP
ncbi:MAG: hypothetical protein H6510_08350 [Acidobacteria bacterium]|nr:hypothetical protein [Acidobacteriota bacterium]MCB9397811.1 hypothetical protein [Acidobacteriota bacterium]